MGYYNALLERKFQRAAGKKIRFVAENYREILVPEEEPGYLQHLRALLPVDTRSGKCPFPLLMLLQLSLCPVTLLFVIDQKIFQSLEHSYGPVSAKSWLEESEISGRFILERAGIPFREEKIPVKSRIVLGDCEETTVRLSGTFSLLLISRNYGRTGSTVNGISAAVSRIIGQIEIPVMVY
ncbi:hypothetical protein J2741_000084 [Methanolinea mesophila]|uniref:hypothetical protein n=1 Tax=Methanolinea mesophila TaxID=547055 RepID=UPI001AE1903A|nr:hypothetical protein [Methanolinea mesophila]MBP1927537.1 hypothetical protein [Methanolinea mesophila]